MAHTKGPWHAVTRGTDGRIIGPDGEFVADTDSRGKRPHLEEEANALLIASAPSLLAERDRLRAALAEGGGK